jgi:hypothetical protein
MRLPSLKNISARPLLPERQDRHCRKRRITAGYIRFL